MTTLYVWSNFCRLTICQPTLYPISFSPTRGKSRARKRADELHGFLCSLGVTIVRAPREDQWAPGYYSRLFEDPDGIGLELNHVPGKGAFGLSGDANPSGLAWRQ